MSSTALKRLRSTSPSITLLKSVKTGIWGIQDELVGLYFEIESKRFLNDRYESVMYGWTDNRAEYRRALMYWAIITFTSFTYIVHAQTVKLALKK